MAPVFHYFSLMVAFSQRPLPVVCLCFVFRHSLEAIIRRTLLMSSDAVALLLWPFHGTLTLADMLGTNNISRRVSAIVKSEVTACYTVAAAEICPARNNVYVNV